MKTTFKVLLVSVGLFALNGCVDKDNIPTPEVQFTADKTTVATGEEVTFTIGSGADALSVYQGVGGNDFMKSRISLVEQQKYSEDQLRSELFAERIPGLKEYLVSIPKAGKVPDNFSFSGKEIQAYDGKLVAWDYSNVTNSKYVRLNLASGAPQTLIIKPNNAVLPTQLNLDNNKLRGLGALSNVANNNFTPYWAFPDGFTPQSTEGTSIRVGIQVVIDGLASPIAYFTLTVRELLVSQNFNLDGLVKSWRTANPKADATKGLDEIRVILNADDPTKTDDDGDLLTYKGNVYIQEVRVGSADNMIKAFDTGVTIPYVYSGTTQTLTYRYNTPGTYTATLVATYIGRKKYAGDGYQTNRANEISAEEYAIERKFKDIQITVN